MNRPPYYSPTQVMKFLKDREDYYLSYLTTDKPPRMAQTQPMCVGSAFDAFIKSHIAARLGLKEANDSLSFASLFEAQVEPQNRDFGLKHGKIVFDTYIAYGCLGGLMSLFNGAKHAPRFELRIDGTVDVGTAAQPCVVELSGKPDIYFIDSAGRHVLVDFKVNGYCAKRPTSPKPGYVSLRDGRQIKMHSDAMLSVVRGIECNIGASIESISNDWGVQLPMYSWILGEAIGSDFVCGIEQIVGQGALVTVPMLRVASFRGICSAAHQHLLAKQIRDMHVAITSGHVFTNLSKDASDAHCKLLDDRHKAFSNTEGDVNNDWYDDFLKSQRDRMW